VTDDAGEHVRNAYELPETVTELRLLVATLTEERDDLKRQVLCRDRSISEYQETVRKLKDRLMVALGMKTNLPNESQREAC